MNSIIARIIIFFLVLIGGFVYYYFDMFTDVKDPLFLGDIKEPMQVITLETTPQLMTCITQDSDLIGSKLRCNTSNQEEVVFGKLQLAFEKGWLANSIKMKKETYLQYWVSSV